MDPIVADLLNLFFRWMHVVAAVIWIGHLYFFNFVNAQVAKSYSPETKTAVVPELMPRALFWFRWGALWTWLSGIVLLGIVYHVGHLMVDPQSGQKAGMAIGIGFIAILFGFFIYDGLWKSPLGKNEVAAGVVSTVLLIAMVFGFSKLMSGRAMYIHIGSVLGGTMMMNVWMRIWPAQKKIIRGIRGEQPAPDASVAAFAALRSKHNVFMSVPLTFFMVSNHFPLVYAHELNWLWAAVAIVLGFVVARFLFAKSAGESPKKA